MADTNPKVMSMIEAELAKNPSISNAELLDKAKKIDRSVGQLSPRAFNARYPLQVKRRKDGASASKKRAKKGRARTKAAPKPRGGAKKGGAKRSSKGRGATTPKTTRRRTSRAAGARSAATAASSGNRAAVRDILLDYARKVAGAGNMTEMMDLVLDVDRYVDRVMKAAG